MSTTPDPTWDSSYPADVTWDGVPTSWQTNPVTRAEVAKYAGAPSGEAIERDLAAALELVSRHIGSAVVPPSVLKSAVLDVTSELYSRRQHHNGVVTFDSPDGVTAMRINRDPMAAAYPILRPYVSPPLA